MTGSDVPSDTPTLPKGVVAVLDEVTVSQRHPGLQLDKLSPPGRQGAQRELIEKVCKAAGEPSLLTVLSKRREDMLAAVGAERFRATTTGSLTLHLARASGLENAGIHLHPVYGFACLPGSGLKGMARAYAETVWLVDRSDPVAAWNDIRAVFGWALRSEEGKCWKPESVDDVEGSSAGSVVFHDAWPVEWPRLAPDLVNNHHKRYYEGEDEPGDWDKPEMAYFLSVFSGTTFDFALSPRNAAGHDKSSGLMNLAQEWLQAALVHEGAGAKTNAGYGRFQLVDHPSPRATGAAHCTSSHTLTLATPAFLAGARQRKEDCDLRPATLRGLLRWWWRTMHTAHLSRENLRRLETAVWGDTETGAALSLSLETEAATDPQMFDKDGFANRHCVPGSQGLRYAAYGMDETKQGKRHQRWYAESGVRWTLAFRARQGRHMEDAGSIEAADILRQGQAALWLLCHYGGVGSKARNGFGSFSDVEIDGIETIEDCKKMSMQFRQVVGLSGRIRHPAKSSSLDDILVSSIDTPWHDPWFGLDQLGSVMQSFARKNSHDERKAALGLPRKIHGPRNDPMRHQDRESHQPPRNLSANGRSRYASPVHHHLAPRADGALIVRMTAFPTADLPDIDTSREVLNELRNHLQSELKGRIRRHAGQGTRPPERRAAPAPVGGQACALDPLPKPGERIEAVLLEERTRKGGWRAKHEPSGLEGPIHNSGHVPNTAEPGQHCSLIVASVSQKEMAFSWPTPEAEARRSRSEGRRRHRGGGSKRRPRTSG